MIHVHGLSRTHSGVMLSNQYPVVIDNTDRRIPQFDAAQLAEKKWYHRVCVCVIVDSSPSSNDTRHRNINSRRITRRITQQINICSAELLWHG